MLFRSALGKMDASKETNYTLEALNEFSKASELKGLMQKLIDQFIKILPQDENGGKSVDYLVLVIDDVDMNVSYAATMLEQIRKFLMLDHLVILMSANMEQLKNEMCEFYSRAFIQTLKGSNEDLVVDVEDLATKYLLKIFPTSRRIHVENPSKRLLDTELRIIADSSNDAVQELRQFDLLAEAQGVAAGLNRLLHGDVADPHFIHMFFLPNVGNTAIFRGCRASGERNGEKCGFAAQNCHCLRQ